MHVTANRKWCNTDNSRSKSGVHDSTSKGRDVSSSGRNDYRTPSIGTTSLD